MPTPGSQPRRRPLTNPAPALPAEPAPRIDHPPGRTINISRVSVSMSCRLRVQVPSQCDTPKRGLGGPATNPGPARRARAENRSSTLQARGGHTINISRVSSPSCDTPERGPTVGGPATYPGPARRARAENRSSTLPGGRTINISRVSSPSCDTPERGLGGPATNPGPGPARRARAENRSSTRPYNQHFAGARSISTCTDSVHVMPTPSPSHKL